jgi:SpoVK/Ycf46/Vps4 family AAA+-type ATPase
MSAHRGVVTVATTNDPTAIDAAARRSCRFDVVLEVPVPDVAARARILERYLAALDADVDIRQVAVATAGYTGADLRELMGNAVLKSARPTTDLLVELTRTSDRRPLAPGQYL